MIIVFENNRKKVETLSPSRLRNSLAQLVRAETSGEVAAFDAEAVSEGNQALLSVLSKLNVSSVTVSSDDVRASLSISGVSGDKISIIFAMSRPHFLAVVYLLISGAIGADDVSGLADLDNQSRTVSLLNLLPNQDNEDNILSLAFDRESMNFFYRPIQRESSDLDVSYFRSRKANPTVVNLAVSMVPDSFHVIKDLYTRRIYRNSLPPLWPLDRWSFNGGGLFSSYGPSPTVTDKGFESSFYKDWEDNKSGVRTTHPTYFASVQAKSSYENSAKTLSTSDVHSFALSSYLPISAVRAFDFREKHPLKESAGFNEAAALTPDAVSRSIAHAIKNDTPSLYIPKYFVFAYWMYANTESIATSERNGTYWNSFFSNTSPGNALRTAEAAALTPASNFSYVDDARVSLFLKDLFPTTYNNSDSQRNDPSYIREYFLNQRGFNSIYPGATVRLFGTRSSVLSSGAISAVRASQISKFDVVARDNGSLVFAGPLSTREYASTAFKKALAKAGYKDTDLLALQTYSEAKEYLEDLRDAVEDNIVSQSGSAQSDADKNQLISDSNANELNRVFVAELAREFFDYLLDSATAVFSPVLSGEAMSTYRLLNFIKHTFINFPAYFGQIRASPFYSQFVYGITLARAGFPKSSAYQATIDGAITTEEIESILPAQGTYAG